MENSALRSTPKGVQESVEESMLAGSEDAMASIQHGSTTSTPTTNPRNKEGMTRARLVMSDRQNVGLRRRTMHLSSRP